MSALLIDDITTDHTWVHVPAPALRVVPAASAPELRRVPVRVADLPTRPARPVGQAIEAGSEWHLTRRGLAAVVFSFLVLMAVSVVALVVGFLSVSNEPLPHSGPAPVVLAGSTTAG